MGTFSINELNSYNFLRWRSANSVTINDIGDATIGTGAIVTYPNQYLLDRTLYIPKFVLGSEISVYANLDTAATDADFANWVGVFVDRYGTINTDHGTFAISQDDFGGGNFRWYFSQTPASNDFEVDQYYMFVIYNTSTEAVKYVTNFMQAKASTEAVNYSYSSYRNSSSLDNFNYTDLTSFRNKISLDLNLIDDQPEIEFDPYNQVTTGKVSTSKTYKKLALTFEAKQYDQEARRALESMFACSDILINTNVVEKKEAPSWSINRRSRLADGTVKFYDQKVSTINLSGYDG